MSKVAIIGLSGDSLFYDLDHLPEKGETLHANILHREVGGKGFNQALALARQGVEVYFLGAVGKDDIGNKCEDFLKQEGIHPFLVRKNIPSACASILKAKDGNNEVIVYDGANKELSIDDLNPFKEIIDLADAVLLTYEIKEDVLKATIEYAKSRNKLIILNPAPYVYDNIDYLKSADIITPNETELTQMFHIKYLDFEYILKEKEKLGINVIVATLGANGCAIIDKEIKFAEGYKAKAIDTTGAGDVFNACLLCEILNKNDLISACKYANKMAALSVEKAYVLDAIPRREENE